MKTAYQIARVAGIPVQVHVTLLFLLPFVLLQLPPAWWAWGLVGMAGLFASVALHELGHSLVAMRKGCRVSHILLLPIGGLARMDRLPSSPRDEVLVAAAGPAVSLLLGLAAGQASAGLDAAGLPAPALVALLLGRVNIGLAVFNLIPSFPMDGGRIFRAWLTPFVGRIEATRRAAKVGRTLAVAFGLWSLLFRFSLLNIAIAVFVYQAAGAEYRTVLAEARLSRTGARQGPAYTIDSDEIVVGPPPYARPRAASWWRQAQAAVARMFDNLVNRGE